MRHRTPKLTTLQQMEALSATGAAERQMLKKELAERRKLLALVFRGVDANIRALAGRGPRDDDLSARAQGQRSSFSGGGGATRSEAHLRVGARSDRPWIGPRSA